MEFEVARSKIQAYGMFFGDLHDRLPRDLVQQLGLRDEHLLLRRDQARHAVVAFLL